MTEKYSICFVEDSRTAAHPVKKFFKSLEDFSFEHFLDAESALSSLKKKRYDVLVTDLSLSTKGMNGPDLIRVVRSDIRPRLNKMPILVTTGSTDDKVLMDVFDAGANDYLIKPVNFTELENRIRNYAILRKNRDEEDDDESVANKVVENSKVCLVEDSRTAALFLTRELKKEKVEVDHYLNAEEGLQAIIDNDYDVLLSDMNLDADGMDGDDLVKALRKLDDPVRSQLPAIIITGDTGEEAIKRVYSAGANDYLSKPVKARELLARIENMTDLHRELVASLQPISAEPEADVDNAQFLEDEDDMLAGVDLSGLDLEDEVENIESTQPLDVEEEKIESLDLDDDKEPELIEDSPEEDEEIYTLDDLPDNLEGHLATEEMTLELEEDIEKVKEKTTVEETNNTGESSDLLSGIDLSGLEIDESSIDLAILASSHKTVCDVVKPADDLPRGVSTPEHEKTEIEEVELSVSPIGASIMEEKSAEPEKTKKKTSDSTQSTEKNKTKPVASEITPLEIEKVSIFSRIKSLIGKIIKLIIMLVILVALAVAGLVGVKIAMPEIDLPIEIPFIEQFLPEEEEEEESSTPVVSQPVKPSIPVAPVVSQPVEPVRSQAVVVTNVDSELQTPVKKPNVQASSSSKEVKSMARKSAKSIERANLSARRKGKAIIVETHNRSRGYVDETAEMTMTLITKHGDDTKHTFTYQSVEIENNENKSILLVTNSEDIKGTALLTYNDKVNMDEQWLYIPAIKRVTKINEANSSGSFAGSEFSYEDLTSHAVGKYSYKWLKNASYGGIPCFVVQLTPQSGQSGYSKIEKWIDKDAFRVMKINYYDKKRTNIKTLTVGKYRSYRGFIWRAATVTMTNHLNGQSTQLNWEKHRFATGLFEADFDMDAMKRER